IASQQIYRWEFLPHLPQQVVATSSTVFYHDLASNFWRWNQADRQWQEMPLPTRRPALMRHRGIPRYAGGKILQFPGQIPHVCFLFSARNPDQLTVISNLESQPAISVLALPDRFLDIITTRYPEPGFLALTRTSLLFAEASAKPQNWQEMIRLPSPLANGTNLVAHLTKPKILIAGNGQLVQLQIASPVKATIGKQQKLPATSILASFLGDEPLVITGEGDVLLFSQELKPLAQATTPRRAPPKQLYPLAGNRVLALLHDGNAYLIQQSTGNTLAFVPLPSSMQGTITAISVLPQERIAVAGDLNRVQILDEHNLHTTTVFSPTMNSLEFIYRFLIRPLYRLAPKPQKLSNLAVYLITGEKTYIKTENLGDFRLPMQIWQPFWSSLAFTLVMLALGCFYIVRKEF
ncbi:MAG: hypothetical protein D6820_02535, partial [Lentisphaerae bacterium]